MRVGNDAPPVAPLRNPRLPDVRSGAGRGVPALQRTEAMTFEELQTEPADNSAAWILACALAMGAFLVACWIRGLG